MTSNGFFVVAGKRFVLFFLLFFTAAFAAAAGGLAGPRPGLLQLDSVAHIVQGQQLRPSPLQLSHPCFRHGRHVQRILGSARITLGQHGWPEGTRPMRLGGRGAGVIRRRRHLGQPLEGAVRLEPLPELPAEQGLGKLEDQQGAEGQTHEVDLSVSDGQGSFAAVHGGRDL